MDNNVFIFIYNIFIIQKNDLFNYIPPPNMRCHHLPNPKTQVCRWVYDDLK